MTEHGDTAPELETIPSRLLGQASALAGQLVSDRLADTGAHRYHFTVLTTLKAFGPSSQAELSRRSWIDRSDMVATLNTLEADGYVERTVDPADKRRNIISMTDAGRLRLVELAGIVANAQDEFLQPLSAAERWAFSQVLLTLIAHHAHTDED